MGGWVPRASQPPIDISDPHDLAIEGFGQFSADLLTFVNPLQWSRFFPAIAMGPRQYEGFAYLGRSYRLSLDATAAENSAP